MSGLSFSAQDPIAVAVIDRPQAMSAITLQMQAYPPATCEQARTDRQIRVHRWPGVRSNPW